ncbi:MAG: hypothetical protein QOF91_230 [Alphaproteobacteria bacterium]|jgi:hypothetical protein|nr:hypothetical protein [Alphaproteobacteria bacterium]
MSQSNRIRRIPGMLVPMAMIVGMTFGMAGMAAASNSELERELQRELHRMPPPALLPTPATLACYERLARISHYAPLPIQSEPAQCATVDLVRLDRVLMPDQTQVAVSPPAVLLCSMAEAVAQFIRADVGLAAASLGAPLAAVTDLDSYECRSRNRIAGAKLSEHGKGNALDISAIKLRNGALFNLTDPVVSRPFREQLRTAACARFTTVLGPGSDSYHSDHIHLDLAERSHGYRICQWNVLEPVVAGDVPLPRPRPVNLTADRSKAR